MAVTASAQQNQKTDPLGMGSWERIVSTEHTAEYLAQTGGIVQPDITGYPYWNAAGNWSFELMGSNKMRPLGDIDLRLFQVGNLLFGKGTFSEGLRQQPVTADGYLSEGNSIVLNVVSLEDVYLYRLNINSDNGNTVSGSVNIFTPAGGAPLTGTIEGGRNEARTFSPLDVITPS
jgi:hypothetical protein